MGQMARENRAGRFIEEFRGECLGLSRLVPGTPLRVTRLEAGIRPGNSVVVLYAVVEQVPTNPLSTTDHLLELADVGELFDPENHTQRDLLEILAERLGLSEQEARQRIEKAGL